MTTGRTPELAEAVGQAAQHMTGVGQRGERSRECARVVWTGRVVMAVHTACGAVQRVAKLNATNAQSSDAPPAHGCV